MRIDLHTHTLLSDGELLPIELARRAVAKGHSALAVTDHVSLSTMERVIDEAKRDCRLASEWDIELILGVELTHVPASKIDVAVAEARRLGAQLIVVHGETMSEPVEPGTNRVAVSNPEVDILAHPGLITIDDAQIAKDNEIVLELTSRSAHALTNGHVTNVAKETGTKLIVNTDAHYAGDLIDEERAILVAMGAGLERQEAERAVREIPSLLIRRLGWR